MSKPSEGFVAAKVPQTCQINISQEKQTEALEIKVFP